MATNIPTAESTVLKHSWRNPTAQIPLADDSTTYHCLAVGIAPKTTFEHFKLFTPAVLGDDITVDIFKVAAGVSPASITPGSTNRLIAQKVLNADDDIGVVVTGDVTAATEGTNVVAAGDGVWAKVVVAASAVTTAHGPLYISWLERTWQD